MVGLVLRGGGNEQGRPGQKREVARPAGEATPSPGDDPDVAPPPIAVRDRSPHGQPGGAETGGVLGTDQDLFAAPAILVEDARGEPAPVHEGRARGPVVEAPQRQVEVESHEALGLRPTDLADGELGVDDQIAGLLHLHHEHPRPDGVRGPGGDEIDLAGADLDPVERRHLGGNILRLHHPPEGLFTDAVLKAKQDVGWNPADDPGAQNDPGFRLAEV